MLDNFEYNPVGLFKSALPSSAEVLADDQLGTISISFTTYSSSGFRFFTESLRNSGLDKSVTIVSKETVYVDGNLSYPLISFENIRFTASVKMSITQTAASMLILLLTQGTTFENRKFFNIESIAKISAMVMNEKAMVGISGSREYCVNAIKVATMPDIWRIIQLMQDAVINNLFTSYKYGPPLQPADIAEWLDSNLAGKLLAINTMQAARDICRDHSDPRYTSIVNEQGPEAAEVFEEAVKNSFGPEAIIDIVVRLMAECLVDANGGLAWPQLELGPPKKK